MKKYFRILHIAVIVLMVCFIFSNSLVSDVRSSAQSGYVRDVIKDVITDGGQKPLKGIAWNFIIYLRKVAHFVEFFFLSVVTTLFAVIFCELKLSKILALFIPVSVAFIDEGLQILNTTRAPSLKDVLINLGGAVCGFAAVALAVIVVEVFKRWRVHKQA